MKLNKLNIPIDRNSDFYLGSHSISIYNPEYTNSIKYERIFNNNWIRRLYGIKIIKTFK